MSYQAVQRGSLTAVHTMVDDTRARFGCPLAAACWLHERTELMDDVAHRAVEILKGELDEQQLQTFGEWLNGQDTPQVEQVERTINAAVCREREAANTFISRSAA